MFPSYMKFQWIDWSTLEKKAEEKMFSNFYRISRQRNTDFTKVEARPVFKNFWPIIKNFKTKIFQKNRF